MNNSPPFKRHSVGRTYPWQVAPQQSLLPFRFNNTKFKSVYHIYNLSKFPPTFSASLLDHTNDYHLVSPPKGGPWPALRRICSIFLPFANSSTNLSMYRIFFISGSSMSSIR